MKKVPGKDRKLSLHKDTVRTLGHVDLTNVVAGRAPPTTHTTMITC